MKLFHVSNNFVTWNLFSLSHSVFCLMGENSQLDLVHLSLCLFNSTFSQLETWSSEIMVVYPSSICCMITKYHQTTNLKLGKENKNRLQFTVNSIFSLKRLTCRNSKYQNNYKSWRVNICLANILLDFPMWFYIPNPG